MENNNAKVLEAISKFSVLNYLTCLIQTKITRLVLFTAFPITNAPNWSDGKELIIIDDPAPLISIVAGRNNLN